MYKYLFEFKKKEEKNEKNCQAIRLNIRELIKLLFIIITKQKNYIHTQREKQTNI